MMKDAVRTHLSRIPTTEKIRFVDRAAKRHLLG